MKIPGTDIEITFRSKPIVQQQAAPKVEEPKVLLPVQGGRSSIPEDLGMGGILGQLGIVNPDYPYEAIEAIEMLAKWNADVSYAVDNIVQLGNTPYTIEFDDSVTAEQGKVMHAFIEGRTKSWYNQSEGLNSLINDLLAQMVITGAISSEIIPNVSLSGVDKIVLVNPKYIRFIYSTQEDKYLPHQIIHNALIGFVNNGALKPLNPITYKYYAIRRFNEKPYAIPPFLSAIESIGIEKDMMCNFKAITKKLGIMGFLNVLVTAPTRIQGESEDAYIQKATNYLNAVIPEIEKGMNKGYAVGFKDTHEFKMENTLANAAGATQIYQLIETIKMAGLKQDPLMLGRNNSTTETLGRVILAKLGTQVANYQKGVGNFISDAILMDLLLGGFKLKSVAVCFEKPMIGDQLRDEQVFTAKITNADMLYNNGTINQDERAQLLGYEQADQTEPRALVNPIPKNPDNNNNAPVNPSPGTASNEVNDHNLHELISELEVELGAAEPLFDYGTDACNCGSHKITYNQFARTPQEKFENFLSKYSSATKETYSKAVKKTVKKVADELAQSGNGATLEQIQDKVIYLVLKNWKTNFTDKEKVVIDKWVKTAYNYFRKDEAIFAGKLPNVPAPTLGLVDTRTINYFKNSDELYLGKFITDPDTKKAITAYIKKQYLENNLPIGSKEGTNLFQETFAGVLEGEAWKIDRVLSTTVNKMRNYAAVNYMEQAKVEKFEVRGVNDRLQCPYCASMQGKQFSVVKALDKVKQVTNSAPNLAKEDNPFVTTVFKKPEEMAHLTGEQLQAAGIDLPAYHPGCRDVIVAVL